MNKGKTMNQKYALAAVVTLLAISLCTPGSSEAGNVTVYNKSSRCTLMFTIKTQNMSYAGTKVQPGATTTQMQESPCPTAVSVLWSNISPQTCRTGMIAHHQLAANATPVCTDIAFEVTENCHPFGLCDPVITRVK